MKAEEAARIIAGMEISHDDIGWTMTREELHAIRRFLRQNKARHSECCWWLMFLEGFVPYVGSGSFHSAPEPEYAIELSALCRQILALDGIIIRSEHD